MMKLTQGAQLAKCLKIWPSTYMEMLSYGISTCPWRRLQEWLDLPANSKWHLVKGRRWVQGHEYLTTWTVRRKP
jgi:hypothetical protein